MKVNDHFAFKYEFVDKIRPGCFEEKVVRFQHKSMYFNANFITGFVNVKVMLVTWKTLMLCVEERLITRWL